jgi:MSHA biogenesis protein MshM
MYYAGEPYDSVLQQLKALLGEPEFFVRLTGTQGSGKSTLLEQIARYYAEQGYLTRYFPSNPDSPMALRSALRKSFGLEKSHNFQRSLQEHLTTEAKLYKGIVLIYDDCHLMNNATLLELTKLTDIQINHSCMLSIIMGGSDKLDDRLNRDHELRPVLQRITLSTCLTAMDQKASALFLRIFFDEADQHALVFDAPALALL